MTCTCRLPATSNPPRPLASGRVEGSTNHPIPNPGEGFTPSLPFPVALTRGVVGGSEQVPPPKETFFAILWLSETRFEFCFEITSKKLRKSRICVSQNPSKILSKTFQNQCPKKRAIFHGFVFEKCFVAQAPTSISYWFLQCFLLVGHFSWFRCSHAFSI